MLSCGAAHPSHLTPNINHVSSMGREAIGASSVAALSKGVAPAVAAAPVHVRDMEPLRAPGW